jgi:hypothetical protein
MHKTRNNSAMTMNFSSLRPMVSYSLSHANAQRQIPGYRTINTTLIKVIKPVIESLKRKTSSKQQRGAHHVHQYHAYGECQQPITIISHYLNPNFSILFQLTLRPGRLVKDPRSFIMAPLTLSPIETLRR